jgi:hypothetical protein
MGVTGGLTVAGSSMAGRDLIPRIVAEDLRDGEPAHNVALGGGGQTTLQERWLLEEVVPRTHPDSIVWGVSSLDFNASRRAATIDRYDAARATRTGFFGAADRALAEVSALARFRNTLRDPYAMTQVLSGEVNRRTLADRPPARAITFDYVRPPLSPQRLARMRRTEAAFARDVQLRAFRVGREEVAAFRRTLRGLRRDDVSPAVVLMPVTQEYIDAHPRGERDFDRWKRIVTRVAREEGVLLLDDTNAVPEAGFRDLEHLDVPAARDYSASVNARLRDAGW